MKHYVYETLLPLGPKREGVADEYCEFVIFARSRARSVRLVVGFQLLHKEVRELWHDACWDAWEIEGTREHLIEALARGEEGLGVYDHIKGWTIIPWPTEKYGPIVEP